MQEAAREYEDEHSAWPFEDADDNEREDDPRAGTDYESEGNR
jgi:hypothetical protein